VNKLEKKIEHSFGRWGSGRGRGRGRQQAVNVSVPVLSNNPLQFPQTYRPSTSTMTRPVMYYMEGN